MNEKEVNAINPNNNVNNKSNTFNLVIGIATLLIALLGATFAYFSATARSAENDVTVKSAYVSISYDGGTEIVATNLIPATETVALSQYMREQKVHDPSEGPYLTDYDKYNSSDNSDYLDRRCVDAKGKEVCYVYQFSVESEGGEGGKTNILGSIKINNNQFENLSYILYKVTLREENGVVLKDKYGFDIVDSYTAIKEYDHVDTNPDNVGGQPNFNKFNKPYDILTEEGTVEETVYPVACLFGDSKEDAALELRLDNTERCRTGEINNNEKTTYQLVIWLEETGEVQEEQGLTFEGTVAIEVSGGVSTDEYSDGKITGQQSQ
mgnify:CR=1 FL=1